ncbi:MAG: hypothetical protein RL414_224, partial [Actinomycetota bacterium]
MRWDLFLVPNVAKSRLLLPFLLVFSLLVPAPTAQSASSTKIAILYDLGGRGDGGINDAAGLGVDKAKKQFRLNPLALREIATDGTDLDRLLKIRFLAKANYSPIILVGKGFESSLSVAIDEFPETQFAIIDSARVGQLNVENLIFHDSQASYVAGVLAASASKTNTVGIWLDPDKASLHTPTAAFIAGAKSVKPKIVVLEQQRRIDAKIDVSSMLDRGADVIYSTWSVSSSVLDVVAERNTKKKPLRYIGVIPDQFFLKSAKAKSVLIGAVHNRIDTA